VVKTNGGRSMQKSGIVMA